MSSWRKCVFGCEKGQTLFCFPKEKTTQQKWVEFVFGNKPQQQCVRNLFVCARHFDEDCLVNKMFFESGLASRLVLKTGAVPTIRRADAEPKASTSQEPFSHCTQPEAASAASHSGLPPVTPLAPSQLSASSQLNNQNKIVQATVSTISRGTEAMPPQPWLLLSSTSIKSSTSDIGERPRKRPRVELAEVEVKVEDDILEIQIPHNSTCEPEAPLTDLSHLTEMESAPDYEDAKYIVFESCLRELFETCPVCKKYCEVRRQRCGTFVSFSQDCPHCLYSRKWQSQPIKGSTPVGDLQVSAAVYFTGGSFTQTEKMFKAMNLQIHQYDTFRRHARMFLEPAIYHKWKAHQQRSFEEIKKKGKIAVAGDMRTDSPGHCAKFGSYSLMELKSNQILDIQLVQSNEIGSSVHMEKEGLRRGLDLLESNSLEVDYIVTDRRIQVQKYLQNRKIKQYHDVWHFQKGLSKKLEKISINKDCQVVKKWLVSIKNHMYWTAASSKTGPEKVAKWTSLVNHIQNVHTHKNPLFPKCAHADRVSKDPNKWFQPGSMALYKVEKLLLNKRVLCDVEKMTFEYQTSSFEAFRSVILRFAPKNFVFPFIEMLCRLYLAAMHFNENVTHKKETSKKYVADLMKLVFTEVFVDPTSFVEELRKVPVPETSADNFERPSKEEV